MDEEAQLSVDHFVGHHPAVEADVVPVSGVVKGLPVVLATPPACTMAVLLDLVYTPDDPYLARLESPPVGQHLDGLAVAQLPGPGIGQLFVLSNSSSVSKLSSTAVAFSVELSLNAFLAILAAFS